MVLAGVWEERGHIGSIFLRGTQLPRCPLSTVTIFLVSCSTAKGAQCFPAGRFVPVLALACMGKAADMGRSSASTSEFFLDGGPCHKYLGTFNAIQNNGVHWDYWNPAKSKQTLGRVGSSCWSGRSCFQFPNYCYLSWRNAGGMPGTTVVAPMAGRGAKRYNVPDGGDVNQTIPYHRTWRRVASGRGMWTP